MFFPHPSLDERINRNISQSEIEGGVFVDKLSLGTRLEVETMDWTCQIEYRGSARLRIWGHPRFCPLPVVVDLHGSTWGGSMLKLHFIGRGMYMEFRHPRHGVILTSRILEIRELDGHDVLEFESREEEAC